MRDLNFSNCLFLISLVKVSYLISLNNFQINHARGIDGPIKKMKTDETSFQGGSGVPNMKALLLNHMSGIQGEILSGNLGQFKCLTKLTIEMCPFITQ